MEDYEKKGEKKYMFRIAICENEKVELLQVQQMVQEYLNLHSGMNGEISSFFTAQELQHAIDKGEMFHTYFLDIVMPGMNGIELGRNLRNQLEDAPIIYITSSKDFALEAFGIHAFDYLEKPVTKERLFSALKYSYNWYLKKKEQVVGINGKSGIYQVNVDDIVCVENISRAAVYTMKDGEQLESVCNRTAFEKSISPLPLLKEFLQPHKSFFINMRYIKALKSDEIVLDSGRKIPISHDKSALSKKEYLKFLAQRGEQIL